MTASNFVLPAAVQQALRTKSDVLQLIQQIEDCQHLLYGSTQSTKKISNMLPQVVMTELTATTAQDTKALDNYLKNILSAVRQLPVVTVAIAYLPTIQQADELIRLVRSGIAQPIVVDLHTEPTLLAGIRVHVGSKQICHSLQAELDEVTTRPVVAE